MSGLEQQLGELNEDRRALQQQSAALEAELKSARQAVGRQASSSAVSSEQLARLQAQLKVRGIYLN